MWKTMIALAAALATASCSLLLSEGSGAPIGASSRARNFIVTLMHTQEPRLPSLRGDPENDRFRLSLLLHSVDGRDRRMVPIAGGLRASDFIHGARFLGDDGRLIWFHAHETAAYDYHDHKLLIGRNLRKTGEPRRTGIFDRTSPDRFLSRAERFDKQFTKPSVVLGAASAQPLRLSAPDGLLITHRANAGYPWTYALSRLNDSGKALWTTDTSLEHLDQILPDSRFTAIIGKRRPADPIKPTGPMLVLINNESGAVSTHSLWIMR